MSEPFLGEIRMTGFNFAPQGWAMCNGQLLSIQQNTALFSLLGTFYGGNGVQTFALPDLRSRVAIHQGQGVGLSPYTIGQLSGSENITLLSNQIPAHNHLVNCVGSGGTQASPVSAYPAIESTGTSFNYSTATPTGQMNPNTIANSTNGNQPHSNIQPYLCINFIIALQGIFPARN
jgi:microcystin-dependent protein